MSFQQETLLFSLLSTRSSSRDRLYRVSAILQLPNQGLLRFHTTSRCIKGIVGPLIFEWVVLSGTLDRGFERSNNPFILLYIYAVDLSPSIIQTITSSHRLLIESRQASSRLFNILLLPSCPALLPTQQSISHLNLAMASSTIVVDGFVCAGVGPQLQHMAVSHRAEVADFVRANQRSEVFGLGNIPASNLSQARFVVEVVTSGTVAATSGSPRNHGGIPGGHARRRFFVPVRTSSGTGRPDCFEEVRYEQVPQPRLQQSATRAIGRGTARRRGGCTTSIFVWL